MWTKTNNSNMDFKVMFPFLVISIFSAFDLQSPQRVLWLRVVIHMKSAGGRVAEQLLPSPNQQSVFLEQHNQGKVETGVVWPRFVSTGCGKHFSLGYGSRFCSRLSVWGGTKKAVRGIWGMRSVHTTLPVNKLISWWKKKSASFRLLQLNVSKVRFLTHTHTDI